MENVFEAFGELYLADSSVEYNCLMHLHKHGKSVDISTKCTR